MTAKRTGPALLLILAFLLATAGAWKILTFPGCYWTTHDGHFGLQRIALAEWAIRDGQLFPRWSDTLYGGYGYPLLQFYPPLFTLLSVALRLAGTSILGGAKAVIFLGYCLGGLFTYRWLRPHGGRWAAFTAAFLFTCFPYRINVVLMRGAFSEHLAIGLLPAILWGVDALATRPTRGRVLATAAAFAALILAHNASFIFFAPAALAYGALIALGHGRPRRLISLALAVAGGMGLSAFYWLPAFLEKRFVWIERLITLDYLNYRGHFIGWQELLHTGWSYGGLGMLLISAVCLAPLLHRVFTRQGPLGPAAWFLPAAAAGYLFLTTRSAGFIWDRITLLQYIDFPWRLLGAAGIMACGSLFVLLQGAAGGKEDAPWTPVAALLVVGLTAGYPPMAAPCHIVHFNESFHLSERELMTNGTFTVVGNEYAPRWAPTLPSDELGFAEGPVTPASDGSYRLLEVLDQRSHRIRVAVSAHRETRLRFNQIYFPGWRARLDGEPVELYRDAPFGLMEIRLPPGSHEVELRFGRTPVRWVGLLVSLLSLAAWLLMAGTGLLGHHPEVPDLDEATPS